MAQFENLQELWQQQPRPAVPAADIARLTHSFRAYGRQQNWINGAKIALVLMVLSWALMHARAAAPILSGLAVIMTAAGLFIAHDWRNQRTLARLDFTAPSLGFVRQTIDRLMEQRDPGRRYYWPFMGAMILGLNLILMGTGHWLSRVLASCLPFAAFELGLWVRRLRFEAECRPLLNQLVAMRAALEDRPE